MPRAALRRRYGHAKPEGLAAAVHAMRVYLGGVDYVSVRDQQKLYVRAQRAVARVAKASGAADAWAQIEREAHRQGVVRPIPGRDV
jgi:hypothetical protein